MQFVGICLAGLTGLWTARDALRRGREPGEAWLWGMGVFLALIVFLPIYLCLRTQSAGGAPKSQTTCRYCGASNDGDPIYCPRCSKQLKGAEAVHGK